MAQQPISPEQAKEAVRTFENNANLQFEGEPGLEEDTSGPAWSHRSWYDLESMQGDHYMVDARTGEVLSVSYAGRSNDIPLDNPPGPLSEEDCLQIAQHFARAKYRDFDVMGLTLTKSEWDGNEGWVFEFTQKLAFGIQTLNSCTVAVRPQDGQIVDYEAVRVSTPAPRQPQITAEQALEIAKQATGIVQVDWSEGATLVADPLGNIYWGLALGGGDAQGKYRGYAVTLNAENGEVVSLAPQRDKGIPVLPPHLRPVPQQSNMVIYFLPVGIGLIVLFGMVRWWRRRSDHTKGGTLTVRR
jgi:hypothetical protein